MTISEITMVPLDSGNFRFPLLFSILIFSSRSIIPSPVGVGPDLCSAFYSKSSSLPLFNSISIYVDNRSSLTIMTFNQPLYFLLLSSSSTSLGSSGSLYILSLSGHCRAIFSSLSTISLLSFSKFLFYITERW